MMRTRSWKVDRWLPAEDALGLARVAHQEIHLGRTIELRVDDHVLLPIQPDVIERNLAKLPHGVRLAGGDHVVVGVILLEHQPHGVDVIGRIAPVAAGFQVAQAQLVLPAPA